MRKGGVVALALAGFLFLGGTVLFYSKYQKSQADYAQATAQEEETRARYVQSINEIAAIQDSLDTIGLAETPLIPAGTQSEMPQTQRDQVLGRIATLKAGLERTKDRIQELDNRLKRNGVRIAGLQRMIGDLKKRANEKEELIAQLNGQLDNLHTQVTGLTTELQTNQQELAQNQQELVARQQELATIFYTMGKKKELMKSGVIVAQGGVLGVGKTLKQSGQFNETSFTAMNTDQETVIRIPAKSVQILSPQPTSSYTLMATAKDVFELHITDAKEFRKVKHLVILMT